MRPNRTMLALASLVAALTLAGCEKGQTDALAAAKARIAKNEDAAAEIDLKNFLQRFPESGEARFLLGQQIQKRGDGAAALIELQRALDLKHPDSAVVPAIAKSLLAQGKFKQIVDEFGKTTLSDPLATAELQGLVAQAMAFDGDTQGANELINRAAFAAPTSEPVQLTKASLAAQAGNTDEAIKVLDALIAKKPDSHLAWTMKGNVLGVIPASTEAAVQAFRKAVELKPGEIGPRSGLIALQLQRGDIAGAEQDLAGLQKAAPKQINTQFYEANLAYAKGKYTEAQSLYQAILRLLPLHPAVLLAAAENELKLNATAQAETLAAKALNQSPDSLRARSLLAQVYLRMGQPAKASATLASLVENNKATPEVLALAAQAQLMNGNVGAAEQLYGQMAKLKPTDPRLRTILATANLGKAGNEQVFGELQSISADDKGIAADMAIVSVRLRARQFDAALKAVETVIQKQPDQAQGYQLKAQVLAQQGNVAGARQALDQALAKDATYLPAVLGLAAIDMRDKKPDLAKQRIEALIKQQPKNAQALIALAELSADGGQPPAEVLGYLERAVKVDPADPSVWIALIDQQVAYDAIRASLTSTQAAVAANPKSIELLDRLARAQVRNGQADQALSTYGKLTSLHPKSLVGLLGQAEVQIKGGNLAEASRTLAKVLERDPQSALAQGLGFGIAMQQQQFKPALEIARKLQAQRPADAVGFGMEADIELAQGRRDGAIALLRKAVSLNRPGKATTKLYDALAQTGKAAEASAMANAWLKDHPNDIDLRMHLAATARQQGQADAAEARYREVLALQPHHVSVLNDLAMLLAQQGKPGGVAMAEQALNFSPDNPAVMDTLAHALVADKQLPKALEIQKKAVLLAPSEPTLRLALAQMELASGDKAAAKRSLDGVLSQSAKLNAEDRAAMTQLAKALNPG